MILNNDVFLQQKAALVEYKKDFYKAETLEDLKTIVSNIETAEKE